MGNKLRKRKPVVQESETRSPSTASTSIGDGDLSRSSPSSCGSPAGAVSGASSGCNVTASPAAVTDCSATASQSDNVVSEPLLSPRYNYKSVTNPSPPLPSPPLMHLHFCVGWCFFSRVNSEREEEAWACTGGREGRVGSKGTKR